MNAPRGRPGRQPRAYGPVETAPTAATPGEDSVDVHVRRWAAWSDLHLDRDVEAVITRIQHINRYLNRTSKGAVGRVGLETHDYETLHALLIRATPGYATTGDLAQAAQVSPATMTGRVDRLVRFGLARRIPSEDDRRVVTVQVTDEGFTRWQQAMELRGAAEAALFEGIPRSEIRRLATLLRRVLVAAEQLEAQDGP